MERIELSNQKSFRIEQELHKNETAGTEVYIAIDDHLKRRVILKIAHYDNNEQKRIIMEEVNNQVALEQYSDYAPKIYNYYEDNAKSKIIIEMQHIEGKSLRTVLDSALKLKRDKVWYDKQYGLLMDITKAVSYIHGLNGFVHKDLKPENIIIVSRRNAVYILDYGISGMALADKGVGTERYMAPEQISGANNNFVYQSTDVFALGQIALEIFGLEPIEYGVDAIPNNASNKWESIKDISDLGSSFYSNLPDIIQKALSLNPKDRYENARAFYEALNRGRRGGYGDKNHGRQKERFVKRNS